MSDWSPMTYIALLINKTILSSHSLELELKRFAQYMRDDNKKIRLKIQ